MGHLEIQCGNCGKRWKVYGDRDFNAPALRVCERCGAEVDPQTWRGQVLPALGMLEDANRELHKDALSGRGLARFKLNYKHD